MFTPTYLAGVNGRGKNLFFTGIEPMLLKVEAPGYKATLLAQPLSSDSQTGTTPVAGSSPLVLQDDERAQRKLAEITRKRNLLLLSVALSLPLLPVLKEQAPIFAAAAMALSSVTVASNSLRLRRFGHASQQ